jgi:hypothetical protein
MAGILDYLNPFQTGGYDPNQQTNTTGTNLPNVFMTPDLYSAGLLSDQNVQNQLQQQATKTGGVLSLVDFATRPRNLRAGSVIPYLGEAYKTGFGGAQNIYGAGLNQLLRKTAFGQKDSPFAKIDISKVDTKESDLTEFSKRLNAGDPTAYNFLKMKQEASFKQTKFNEKFDERAVPELVDFVIGGGFADAQKSLVQLNNAVNELENTPEGTITGRLIGAQPDWYRSKFNRQSVANQEKVEEIVQRNLRLILGAAFTAKEGEQLISRAYNPNQTQAENARRVRLLQKQIYDAAKTKQEAYEYAKQYDTLEGFEGKLYTQSGQFFDDYDAMLNAEEKVEESEKGSGDWMIVQ